MSLFSGITAGLNIDARSTSPEAPQQSGGGWFGGMLRRPIAGVPVTTDSALSYSAVWACVRLISEHIAMMPHRVYQSNGDRREIANSHGADHLLYRMANPETTSFDFKQSLLAAALAGGNGIAE